MNSINKMSFFDHLDELRHRMIISIIVTFVFAIISYIYSDIIIEFLIKPINDERVNLQVLKITSIFMTKIGVSIIVGIFFSFPFILYQALRFILPAFKNLTSKKIIYISILSLLLFIIGLFFGYKIVIPFSTLFFQNLAINMGFIELSYTLENYLVYFIWILIISSLIFQLPFILILIVKIGLVDIDFLKSNRRYVIVFFFILAALLTPPDPVSQLLIVLPLYLLFEFSLLLLKII